MSALRLDRDTTDISVGRRQQEKREFGVLKEVIMEYSKKCTCNISAGQVIKVDDLNNPVCPKCGGVFIQTKEETLKIKPLNENVLVQEVEEGEQKTVSGIITRTVAQEKKKEIIRAKVIATPAASEDFECIVEVGDTVIFDKYQAMILDKQYGERLHMIAVSDLKGKVDDRTPCETAADEINDSKEN